MRQGDAPDPLRFHILLEIAIRKCRVESWGNIFDKCSQIMAYADDVVVMRRRLWDVEDVFTSLIEQTNKMGLETNKKKKTKFMIVSQKPYDETWCI